MPAPKRTKKQLEKITNELYNKHFNCVPVNIMALGKITKELEAIYLADDSEENKAAQYGLLVEKYREQR